MLAIHVQSVLIILLFATFYFIKSNSISMHEGRRNLKLYIQEEQHSIPLVKFRRVCVTCFQMNEDPNNSESFKRHENGKVEIKHNPLRYARNLEIKGYDFHKRLPIPFSLSSLGNFFFYLFGTQTEPRHNNRIGLMTNEDKINKKQNIIESYVAHVKSTPIPASRLIRSTDTEIENITESPSQLPVTEHNPPLSAVVTPPNFILLNQTEPNVLPGKLSSRVKLEYVSEEIASIHKSELQPNNSIVNETPALLQDKFVEALDEFDRKYYAATSAKLFSISPPERRENGISFVESGLFLFLVLSALSTTVDNETKSEIDSCLSFNAPNAEKINVIRNQLANLPPSSEELKFRWSIRLIVNNSWEPLHGAENLPLLFNQLRGNETTEQLLQTLNNMVEQDSGGAMRDTFEEDELSHGARAVLIQTMYVRARWRSAPTLLNGTRPFYNADAAAPRTTRMLRLNDVMRYADLTEWDAQAVEISYATPGLSLLVLVPRGPSLRSLSARAAAASLSALAAQMKPLRVAVTLPIYTLRMTLLLPNKLQAMGISRLVTPVNDTTSNELRLSHAVQRLMFWAEAGRNAFKDDGFEWDNKPDLELTVDRPYLFYVRWRNMTLMNGNFVL